VDRLNYGLEMQHVPGQLGRLDLSKIERKIVKEPA
jgi:hypothetical protein